MIRRRIRIPVIFSLLFALLGMQSTLALAQDAEPLPRRAYLGVRVAALDDAQRNVTDYGVGIVSVFPDSTASAYGLQTGQIILQANGQRLQESSDLPTALAGLRSGAEVEFVILANGEQRQVTATLQAFPAESHAGTDVYYDSVSTVTGQQRTILTVPQNIASPPAVYILQGIDCSSIDMALNPGNSMSLLVEKLSAAGFATYRVEKSGRGDSRGQACAEIGFNAETAGFRAGMEALVDTKLVDSDRIYLLGISLGGIWAPMLAGQEEVAGVISFGTIAKTWPEYMYDNWRRQWDLAGKTKAATERDLKLANAFWYQLITEARAPAEIFELLPQTSALAASVGYRDGEEILFGRHYSFIRELAETHVMGHWESVTSPTLLLWGRGDYVASEADQQLIYEALQDREVDVQLQYLDVDHYWREASDFASSYQGLRSGERAEINESVYTTIIEWLTATG